MSIFDEIRAKLEKLKLLKKQEDFQKKEKQPILSLKQNEAVNKTTIIQSNRPIEVLIKKKKKIIKESETTNLAIKQPTLIIDAKSESSEAPNNADKTIERLTRLAGIPINLRSNDVEKNIEKQTETNSIQKNEPVKEIDLCIGLDVGTSTTKVVIQQAYTNKEDDVIYYLVDFRKHGIPGQEYLIPTCIDEDLYGNFKLPEYHVERKISNSQYTNLKLNFMDGIRNADKYFCVYVALIIKYAQSWFKEFHGNDDIIKNKKIIWHVNMGIPSAEFNDKGKNDKFLNLLKEAYYSLQDETTDKESADLNIVPEIVASIQTYIRKKDIEPKGLYCVSDIGAGTIDICTFRVHTDNDGNIIYTFFKSEVARLGTTVYQNALLNYKKYLSKFISDKEREIRTSVYNITVSPETYSINDEITNRQKVDISNYKELVKKVIAK